MPPEDSAPLQPAGSQDFGDLLLRLISFVAGGALAYGMFLSTARSSPDEAAFLWTSVVGSGGAMALYGWHARGQRARSLRWYATLALASGGAVLAHLIMGTLSAVGEVRAMAFAAGASVGIGVPHGLILGASIALMLYGLRGPAKRRLPAGALGGPQPVAVAVGEEDDDPPTSEESSPTSRPRSKALSGVAGASLFLAPPVALSVVSSWSPAALWVSAVAVCAAVVVVWIRMARSGRPLGSRHILVQAVTVVVFSCAAGWSLLLLVASPLAGIVLALVYWIAAVLLLRAFAGGPGPGGERVGEGPGSTGGEGP